jgi:signal transduction histidine kinase
VSETKRQHNEKRAVDDRVVVSHPGHAEVRTGIESILWRMLDLLPVGIVLLDACDDFRIIYSNPAHGSWADADRLPLEGKLLRDAFDTVVPNGVEEILREVVASGVSRHWHRTPFVGQRGAPVTLPGDVTLWDWDVFPVPSSDGVPRHVLMAFTNQTESEIVNETRRQFMNMAAHELRTPLTVIAGYLSLLRDGSCGPVPSRWEKPLAILDRQAADLAGRIEDILLAARLEQHEATTVGDETVAVDVLVAEALDRARPRAGLLDAVLSHESLPASTWVKGRGWELGRVMDILLDNAMTYSAQPADIRVLIRVAGSTVDVLVEDAGRGIPAQHHEGIFEQFYRVDDPHFGYPAGTGLGLYIGRKLAEANGGELDLERSREGHGSTFRFRLQLAMMP